VQLLPRGDIEGLARVSMSQVAGRAKGLWIRYTGADMTNRRVALVFVSLLLASGASAQIASDSNVSTKLTGNLVLHSQTGRHLRVAPVASCGSSDAALTTSGSPNVPYDLFVQLQDVTLASPPDAVQLWIDYAPASSNAGLEVISCESFASTEIRHPNAKGEDWPAPGSGITLVFGQESPAVAAAQDQKGTGSRALGRFLVQANGDADFRFAASQPAHDGVAESKTDVVIHDASGFQTLASPDNVGTIAFGSKVAYDPCRSTASVDQKAAEVALGSQPTLFATADANPSTARVQWSIASSKTRSATVALYSVSGRRVRNWKQVTLVPGMTRLIWDGLDAAGSRASTGVYYLEVTSDDGFRVVTKAVLLSQ